MYSFDSKLKFLRGILVLKNGSFSTKMQKWIFQPKKGQKGPKKGQKGAQLLDFSLLNRLSPELPLLWQLLVASKNPQIDISSLSKSITSTDYCRFWDQFFFCPKNNSAFLGASFKSLREWCFLNVGKADEITKSKPNVFISLT